MERSGASIKDRTGESRLFETILVVVLLEYYCFMGLYIQKVLIMIVDFKLTLIDT